MQVKMLIVIALTLAAGQSFGQMAKEFSLDNASATGLGADLSAGFAAPTNASLGSIWSVTGIEPGPVIMALHQEGVDLFGAAKYEPDSGLAWNAVVVGKAKGDRVDLTITALQGEALVSSRLNGTFDSTDQSIKGDFFLVSDGRITKRGEFKAIWVNPDTSSYAPAKVVLPGPAAAASSEPGNLSTSQTQKTEIQAYQPPVSKASRFHDVHQDADRILTGVGDISQIPIGMGGGGLA
jgi:hypothetical protein